VPDPSVTHDQLPSTAPPASSASQSTLHHIQLSLPSASNDAAQPSSLQPSSSLSSSPQSPKMVADDVPSDSRTPNCIPNGSDRIDNNCSPVSSLVGVSRPLSPSLSTVKLEIQHEDVTDDDDDAANAAVKAAILSPGNIVNGFRSTVEDITDDEEPDMKPPEQIEIKPEIKTEKEEPSGIENELVSIKEEVKEEADNAAITEEPMVTIKEEVKTEEDAGNVVKTEVGEEEANESTADKSNIVVSDDPPGKKGVYCYH
jgi:hypothetical protein